MTIYMSRLEDLPLPRPEVYCPTCKHSTLAEPALAVPGWFWELPRGCKRCRQEQRRSDPYVYALWFEGRNLLKIGRTTHHHMKTISYNIRTSLAAKLGIQAHNIQFPECIWTFPGNVIEESFIQTYLLLRAEYTPYQEIKVLATKVPEWIKTTRTKTGIKLDLHTVESMIKYLKDTDQLW